MLSMKIVSISSILLIPPGCLAAALISSNLICREKQIVGIWPSGPTPQNKVFSCPVRGPNFINSTGQKAPGN